MEEIKPETIPVTSPEATPETLDGDPTWDILIIGAGPAGLAAALYAARAMRKTVVLEKALPGGQIATTSEVEDYPGIEMTTGPELSMMMMQHAEKFGAEMVIGEEVVDVDFREPIKIVRTDVGKTYRAKSVIIATGAEYRKLGVPGERELGGRGVSYCAVCDGPFFKERHLAVVGGGDAAFDEALYLTKYASKVTIIHRRDEFRAQKVLVDRASRNPKVEFILNTVVEKVNGNGAVDGLTLRNLKSGEIFDLAIGGVFVYIGNTPATRLFEACIKMDDNGYFEVDPNMATGVPGVFVAGDVRKSPLKQVVTAGSDGSIAALTADKYLDDLEQGMTPDEAEAEAESPESWRESY
jgi:thioredoxin reductase (NADPH)